MSTFVQKSLYLHINIRPLNTRIIFIFISFIKLTNLIFLYFLPNLSEDSNMMMDNKKGDELENMGDMCIFKVKKSVYNSFFHYKSTFYSINYNFILKI